MQQTELGRLHCRKARDHVCFPQSRPAPRRLDHEGLVEELVILRQSPARAWVRRRRVLQSEHPIRGRKGTLQGLLPVQLRPRLIVSISLLAGFRAARPAPPVAYMLSFFLVVRFFSITA